LSLLKREIKLNKINSVEGIRGIAATIVIFSHFCYIFFPFVHRESENGVNSILYDLPFGFIYSGTFAVYVFFVLSGYILSLISESYTSNLFVLSVKRYLRLGIPVFISVLIAYVFFILFTVDKSNVSSWISNYGNFDYSFIGAINSGIIGSLFAGDSNYNFVLWTMQIEFFGSILIYIIYIQKKINFRNIMVLMFVSVVSLYLVQVISSKLMLGLLSILVGSILYEKGKELRTGLSIILFVAALYLAGVHNNSLSYSFISSFLGSYTYEICNFFAGIIIVYTILFSKLLSDIFSTKLCVFLGKVSFSIYLIHLPILSVFSIYCFNLLYINNSLSYFLSSIITFILSMGIIFSLALYYYKFIDLFSLRASKKVSISLDTYFSKKGN